MNKTELTAQVAKEAKLTQDQAGKAIDALLGAVQSTLAAGDQVTLIGFGSFSVAHRAARIGRNPQTGAEIQIAASRIPQFKPGQNLKTAVALKAGEAPVAPKAAEAPKTPVVPKAAETQKTPVAPKVAATPKTPVVPKAVESAKTVKDEKKKK